MRRSDSEAGINLIQLSVGMILLMTMILAFGGVSAGAARFLGQQRSREKLAYRGLTALDRMAGLVRGSDGESFIADPFGAATLPDGAVTEIQVRRFVGVQDDGRTLETRQTRILWRIRSTEKRDQADNNRNGLVDEGDLVAIEADGSETLIAQNVPEQGLRIRDTGDGFVDLTLTLELRGRHDDRVHRRSFSTKVPLR